MTAFVASEAEKQFNFMISNNLLDFALVLSLYIDGVHVRKFFVRAGIQDRRILGIRKSATSMLPFKFQELELVDPDLEDAPVVPEMGTIELRAFRCQDLGSGEYKGNSKYRLRQGRISERSKKAGWHHVSTSDEIFTNKRVHSANFKRIDAQDAPCASVKVFYRPREILMAQGVIFGCGVGAGIDRGSEVDNRKCAMDDGLSGPSRRRTRSSIKKEEVSAGAHARRIQALLGKLDANRSVCQA